MILINLRVEYLTLIGVGYLGVRFEVEGIKIRPV